MNKFNIGDICRFYMPHSPELHTKLCTVVARSDDWKDYSVVCQSNTTTCLSELKHFIEMRLSHSHEWIECMPDGRMNNERLEYEVLNTMNWRMEFIIL